MKKIFKSRRGIAVLTAVLFMLITFSFCALLTMMALSGNSQTKIESIRLTQSAALDQIGEDFLHFGTTKSVTEYETATYTCEQIDGDSGEVSLKVTVRSDDRTVLYVKIAEHGTGKNTLLYWGRTEPTT